MTSLATSPALGRRLLSGSLDGTVRLWDLDKGEVIRQVDHGAPVTSVALRADGKGFASGGSNSVVKLWTLEEGKLVAELKGDAEADARVARLERDAVFAKGEIAYRQSALDEARKREKIEAEFAAKSLDNRVAAEKTLTEKQKGVLAALEARVAAKLRHPHVVDVTDVGEHEGAPFLAMEFLEGVGLDGLLERRVPLPPSRAVDVLLPILAALAHAHDASIVHRDVKPSNVLLAATPHGEVPKLLDFGISKPKETLGGPRLTAASEMLGTPWYMAPEQLVDAASVDLRCDLWAMGAILYECLVRAPAFPDDNVVRTLQAVAAAEYVAPRRLRPEIARELNVDAVLEGSALLLGNRVRVSIQLVAARDERWELYDLTRDRAESNNLAKQYPEKVRELETEWNRRLTEFTLLAEKTAKKGEAKPGKGKGKAGKK